MPEHLELRPKPGLPGFDTYYANVCLSVDEATVTLVDLAGKPHVFAKAGSTGPSGSVATIAWATSVHADHGGNIDESWLYLLDGQGLVVARAPSIGWHEGQLETFARRAGLAFDSPFFLSRSERDAALPLSRQAVRVYPHSTRHTMAWVIAVPVLLLVLAFGLLALTI